MVAWFCSCGWNTADPRSAFRHRDEKHIVHPLTREESEAQGLTLPFSGTGIEKFFLEEEIRESAGYKGY